MFPARSAVLVWDVFAAMFRTERETENSVLISAFRARFTQKELTAKTTRTIRIFNRASNTIRLKTRIFQPDFSCPTLMFGSTQVPTHLAFCRVTNAVILDANQGVNFIFDQNDADNFQKSKFFNGQLVLTHVFNEKLVFQGFYSGLKTSRKNENGILGSRFSKRFDFVFSTARFKRRTGILIGRRIVLMK